VLTATAALASIGAIFDQLTTAPAGHNLLNLVFAVVTILLSWSVIQVIFAFHYAHEYCAEHRGQVRGLGFPGDDAPSACSKLSRKFNRQSGGLMNGDQALNVSTFVSSLDRAKHAPPLLLVPPRVGV
jgi:hypothetical protein